MAPADYARRLSGVPARIGNRPLKTAALLAETILSEITDSHLEAGAALPAEIPMMAKYGVGRGTLREALRFLEMQGVITIRPGPRGGPVVAVPDVRHLASTMALLLQFSRTPFRAIVELRTMLEPEMAALAAAHADQASLDEMREGVQQMGASIGNLRVFLQENERFHDLVAVTSNNLLFGYLLASLHWIIDGSALGVQYPDWSQKVVYQAHLSIYEAIAKRNSLLAKDRMHQHLEQFAKYVEEYFPSLMSQPVVWDSVAF